jgi:hypothetical protein
LDKRPSIPLAGRFYFLLCVYAVLRAQFEKLHQDFNADGTTTIFPFPVICNMGAPYSMDGKDCALLSVRVVLRIAPGLDGTTGEKRRKDWGFEIGSWERRA